LRKILKKRGQRGLEGASKRDGNKKDTSICHESQLRKGRKSMARKISRKRWTIRGGNFDCEGKKKKTNEVREEKPGV